MAFFQGLDHRHGFGHRPGDDPVDEIGQHQADQDQHAEHQPDVGPDQFALAGLADRDGELMRAFQGLPIGLFQLGNELAVVFVDPGKDLVNGLEGLKPGQADLHVDFQVGEIPFDLIRIGPALSADGQAAHFIDITGGRLLAGDESDALDGAVALHQLVDHGARRVEIETFHHREDLVGQRLDQGAERIVVEFEDDLPGRLTGLLQVLLDAERVFIEQLGRLFAVGLQAGVNG